MRVAVSITSTKFEPGEIIMVVDKEVLVDSAMAPLDWEVPHASASTSVDPVQTSSSYVPLAPTDA